MTSRSDAMHLPTKSGAVELPEAAVAGLRVKYRGVPVDDQLALMALWLEQHPTKRPANVWRFVDNWLRKVQPKKAPMVDVEKGWWATDSKTLDYGVHVNIMPRMGETMSDYRERLFAEFRARRDAA